jgi:hypothetical protein
MTIEEIARIIENPSLCKLEQVGEMEALVQKYPYAQTFSLLLLQTLGKNKDINFEDALANYAYRIGDRKHLYLHINEAEQIITAPDFTLEKPQEKEIKTVSLPVEDKVENEEIAIDEVPEESIAFEPIAEILIEEAENEFVGENRLETDAVTAAEISEAIREDVEISAEGVLEDFQFLKVEEMDFEPVQIDMDDDDKFVIEMEEKTADIVTPTEIVIDHSEESTEVETLEIQEDESIQLEIEKRDLEPIDAVSESIHKEQENSGQANKEEVLEVEDTKDIKFQPLTSFDPSEEIADFASVEEFASVEPSAFAAESKTIEFESIEKKEDIVADELTSNAISEGYHLHLEQEHSYKNIGKRDEENVSEEKRSFTDWLKVAALTHSLEYQVKQQRIGKLVDKFIEEEPKITRISKTEIPEKKSAEFFNVSKIAKASLSEKAIPASQTLAEIFESQGNFSKAIDLYEQLMLLNPEKKSFFANQIKKLKNKNK